MNVKMAAIICVVAVAAVSLALFFSVFNKPVTPPEVTSAEESILSDQINALTDEQLEAISTDISDFSTATEDSIASDNSIFMYS